jgi:streptomycin 6-kinase
MTVEVDLPAKLRTFADRGEAWAGWISRLPALTAGLLDEWGLTVDAASMHGECALVVPVTTADGVPAVLKVGWPHEEAEHEHLALRFWAGRGAVRLLRADPHRSALLLERLDTTDLTTVPVEEACEIVASLYRDLHVPATPEFRTLSALCNRWVPRLTAVVTDPRLPRRYVERAAALTRELAADPRTDGVIIHGDLHFENVLKGERRPWLVIDPKPMSGDPAFEIAPLLWNRWDEILASGDARAALRRRFETVVDVAELDEERAKAWVIVRMLVNAMWEIEDPSPASDLKGSWLTDAITIAKAMDD